MMGQHWPNRRIKAFPIDWETSRRTIRQEEVLLCRLRIGHTRATHCYLLEGRPLPVCCGVPLSVSYLLLSGTDYTLHRLHYLHNPQDLKSHTRRRNHAFKTSHFFFNSKLDKLLSLCTTLLH